MWKDILDSIEITPYHIKIFLITFIAVSVMVGLQHLGIHSPFAFISLDK